MLYAYETPLVINLKSTSLTTTEYILICYKYHCKNIALHSGAIGWLAIQVIIQCILS